MSMYAVCSMCGSTVLKICKVHKQRNTLHIITRCDDCPLLDESSHIVTGATVKYCTRMEAGSDRIIYHSSRWTVLPECPLKDAPMDVRKRDSYAQYPRSGYNLIEP